MSDVTMCQTTCMSGRSIVFSRKSYFQSFMFFSDPKMWLRPRKGAPTRARSPLRPEKKCKREPIPGFGGGRQPTAVWIETRFTSRHLGIQVQSTSAWQCRVLLAPRIWAINNRPQHRLLGRSRTHAAPLSKMISDISLFSHCEQSMEPDMENLMIDLRWVLESTSCFPCRTFSPWCSRWACCSIRICSHAPCFGRCWSSLFCNPLKCSMRRGVVPKPCSSWSFSSKDLRRLLSSRSIRVTLRRRSIPLHLALHLMFLWETFTVD